MELWLSSNISLFGPAAVLILLLLSGLGIPLSEDLIIIPAGVFVGEGSMPAWPTFLCAYFGVVASDYLWFGICYRYGTPLLHKRWFKRFLHPRRLLEAKHQIERRGIWVVVMARFIPGSRTPAITMAGMLHMPFWKFAIATAMCVMVTVPVQLGLGILIARNIGTESTAKLVLSLMAAVAVIFAIPLAIGIWRHFRAERKNRPRAKAHWLRRFRVPRLPHPPRRKDADRPPTSVKARSAAR